MRREERVTVQGPVKEQQPDGMSHRGPRFRVVWRGTPGAVRSSRDGGGGRREGAAPSWVWGPIATGRCVRALDCRPPGPPPIAPPQCGPLSTTGTATRAAPFGWVATSLHCGAPTATRRAPSCPLPRARRQWVGDSTQGPRRSLSVCRERAVPASGHCMDRQSTLRSTT